MSIPTNNLYDFVHQTLENKFIVKYFYPWGQKKFTNVVDHPFALRYDGSSSEYESHLTLLCHDQEPLDFDLYSDENLDLEMSEPLQHPLADVLKIIRNQYTNLNLRWVNPITTSPAFVPQPNLWTLLHSELNSDEVVKYEQQGLWKCAYWWSHAIIARDWYRFAQYDQELLQSQDKQANWLVYSRDTTGKRQYRKQFLDMLEGISSIQIGSFDKHRPVSSDSSAEYDANDFTKSNCSIVLETVYDNRIHLTEKTLRPIACGHPFMILSGPNTLAYLRTHGFKTFAPYINEAYDQEKDGLVRMSMVVEEIKRINNLDTVAQQQLWSACKQIAQHNKQIFFSDGFYTSVKQELYRNVFSV